MGGWLGVEEGSRTAYAGDANLAVATSTPAAVPSAQTACRGNLAAEPGMLRVQWAADE